MKQNSCSVAIITDNSLLVLLRGKTAPYNPSCYCLPGGMREDNESLINCAVRETFEETGININESELTEYIVRNKNRKRIIYIYRPKFRPDVTISWEHSEYVYMSLNDLFSQRVTPGLATVIKNLSEDGLLT